MAIADDKTLLELAANRARPLYPVLDRAAAFSPLLVVLAVVPLAIVAQYQTLTEIDAVWGLKALDLLTADSVSGMLDPEISGDAAPLLWLPPAGSWVTAATMRLLGPTNRWSMWLPAYLSGGLALFALLRLTVQVAGARIAAWTCLFAALHASWIVELGTAAPVLLSMALCLEAMRGLLAHLPDADDKPVSWNLLWGGIALGLCLLTGGPLALMAVLILLIHVLTLQPDVHGGGKRKPASRSWESWDGVKSLLILVATGFATGGWWMMMMFSRHGGDFWFPWLLGRSAAGTLVAARAAPVDDLNFLFELIDGVMGVYGGVTGLCVLGLWLAIRNMAGVSEERRSWLKFTVIWFAAAGAVWCLSGRTLHGEAQLEQSIGALFYFDVWRLFLLIPGVMLTAYAVEQIGLRRTPVLTVAAVALATLFLAAWRVRFAEGGGGGSGPLLLGTGVLTFLALAWLLRRLHTQFPAAERWFLHLVVWAHVLAVGFTGLRSSLPTAVALENQRALANLRPALDALGNVTAVRIINDGKRSFRMRFALRTVWPDRNLLSVTRNWDEALASVPAAALTGAVIFVDWGTVESRPANTSSRNVQIEQLPISVFFDERRVRVFRLTASSRPISPAESASLLAAPGDERS